MEPHRSPGLLGESEKRVAGNLEKTVCLIQSWSSQACRLLTEDPPSPPSTPVLCSHLQRGDSSPHILTQSPRGHYCTVTEDFPPPFPGGLPNPGIEPRSPTLQVDSSPTEPQGIPILKKSKGCGLKD